MTRVFFGCFIILVLTCAEENLTRSYNDVYYLLDTYSPYASNLTLIRNLLENKAGMNDPEGFSKLGEFWLLGLPMATDEFYEDSDFMDKGKFVRNFDLAAYYLKKSLSSSQESSFFVNLLLQQSLLVEGLDKYTPVSGVNSATFKQMQEKSITQLSALGIISTVNQYQMCLNRVYVPEFLRSKAISTIPSHLSKGQCGYHCEELAYLALHPATKSLEFLQRTNKEVYEVPSITDHDLLTASRLSNILKMYEKQSSVSKHIGSLANFYIQGHKIIGMKPELETGLRILEKSASQGNTQAHESLGVLYSEGRYVEKNVTKAIAHLKTAMNKGSITAYTLLGQIYLSGNDVAKDEELGLKYLKYAAQNADPDSYKVLGNYYFLKKNWEEALKYLEISASLGAPTSMYYYGIMSLEGLGTSKNCYYALEMFKQVALAGSLKKYAENGFIMYLNNDLEGAFLNFLVSGSLGVENSLLNLAYMYQQELVPEKFKCKNGKEFCAGFYYHQAYKNIESIHKLAKIIATGSEHFAGNYTEAGKLFKKSEKLPESLYELAIMSEYGLGVNQNLTKAEEIFTKMVQMAESGRIDKDSKYPALLALGRIWVKTHPISSFLMNLADSFTEYLNELLGYQML